MTDDAEGRKADDSDDDDEEVTCVGEGFTQKERLLLDTIRTTFAELGPEALQLMELIVTKSNNSASDSSHPQTVQQPVQKAKAKKGQKKDKGKRAETSTAAVPSLRGIERFFLRLKGSDAAYWRVRPTAPNETIVPAEWCAGDALFRNDHHVFPVHVFASLKRMATQWQKRYVDNFGRRTKAVDWPFPTTICQSNCFGWLFSEQILHRLRLLTPILDARDAHSAANGRPVAKKKRSNSKRGAAAAAAAAANSHKRQRLADGSALDLVRSDPLAAPVDAGETKTGRKAKLREVYLYNYPRYVPAPPIEGAGPASPLELLPLMDSTPEVVKRHYSNIVERLLFQTVLSQPDASADTWATVVANLDSLPCLYPIPPSSTAPRDAAASATNGAALPIFRPGKTWSDPSEGMLPASTTGKSKPGATAQQRRGLCMRQGQSSLAELVDLTEAVEDGSNLPAFLFETLPANLRTPLKSEPGVKPESSGSSTGGSFVQLPILVQDGDRDSSGFIKTESPRAGAKSGRRSKRANDWATIFAEGAGDDEPLVAVRASMSSAANRGKYSSLDNAPLTEEEHTSVALFDLFRPSHEDSQIFD